MADKSARCSVNTPDEVAEIAKAWAEGKEIERQCCGTAQWSARTRPETVPDFGRVKYRVKPSPMEIRVLCRSDGTVAQLIDDERDIPELLKRMDRTYPRAAPYNMKRFREVVE